MTSPTTYKCIIYSKPEQVSQLFKYAKSHTMKVIKVFEISDTADKKRLYEMMEYIIDNGIDNVIIPDCITLSSKIPYFISLVNQFTEMGKSLHIADIDISSSLDDETFNPAFKNILKVISKFDETFREETKERLQNGLKRYLDNGGTLGRAIGYRKSSFTYRRQYYRELSLLEDGVSMKQCRRLTGTSLNTLKKLKRLFLTSK